MKVEVARFDGLATARKVAGRAIDEAAEAARGKHVTLGAGQAQEYEMVRREAEVFLRNGVGGRAVHRMLQATVDAGVAGSLQEAAEAVAAAAEAWDVAGAAIRRGRLQAKRLISAASTQREVAELRDQAVAALAQI